MFFIDLDQPNNGKASILCEAGRLLKDLLSQIELLTKENASLLSESNYVSPLICLFSCTIPWNEAGFMTYD